MMRKIPSLSLPDHARPDSLRPRPSMFLSLVMIAVTASAATAADVIEFLSGARVEGAVTKIEKKEKKIVFEAIIAGRKRTRVYPYSRIHAVTYRGKRYVLTEKVAKTDSGKTDSGKSTTGRATKQSEVRRSNAQVLKLIDQVGRTPPAWYEGTPLNYPKSLDLSWPHPPPKGWNNQKNVGQYIWDVINPNTNKWQEGVRLMHHLLELHKDNPRVRIRVIRSLAGMYFRFFQDYTRAAFWWKQAGVRKGDADSIALAECYWRLGNRKMAEDLLNHRTLRASMIKLWGDMGQTRRAIQLADTYVRVGGQPHQAYLFAGDACRLAGKFPQAIRYYQKVIDAPASGKRKQHADKLKKRARASQQTIRLFETLDVGRVADGTYNSNAVGYAGPVHVSVSVKGGRIEAVKVTRHQEKQFYSAIRDVPRQIVKKQGVKGVDATSRATITAEAIINATAKALADGKK